MIPCTIKHLDNYTPVDNAAYIAALASKYWGDKGVSLGVAFMTQPTMSLANRILLHMNAWGKHANVKFFMTGTDPKVRIAFEPNGGYWSYLGTDILSVPRNKPTMNLAGFSDSTPESEFLRVVRHETGHTLGFPHEHMRAELVNRLDPAKTIAYFQRTQGWSADQTRAQVLTPLPESALLRAAPVESTSIMCYQLPGLITKDGQPIPGGTDITRLDHAYAATIYPKDSVVTKPKRLIIEGEFTAREE
jgi:hypothetical protein